jgi:hypothetical protein
MDKQRKKDQKSSPPGSYGFSRFNATRHGILSKHILLPWEPREEYEGLHLSLRKEYAPLGPMEDHLVEEIAGIIWRKRRLRMADTASFQSKAYRWRNVNGNPEESDNFIKWEFPNIDDQLFQAIFNMTSEEWAYSLQLPKLDQICTQRALKILDAHGPEAFPIILKELPPRFRQHWQELVERGEYSSKSEDFRNYLVKANDYAKQFIDFAYEKSSEMAKAHGMIFNPEILDNLSRYEVFLDRKLEKTLSMLLKLQAIREERKKVQKEIE